MIRIFGTIFAGLLGLAFGSFLNVCLSRWPEGESIVHPRSHCRNCDHTLAWWENIPLVSWLALRGRCRKCRAWIGWRYPLVELAVGTLWAIESWQYLDQWRPDHLASILEQQIQSPYRLVYAIGWAFFLWLLTALAVLDAENLWLPDRLTLSGIVLGFPCTVLRSFYARWDFDPSDPPFLLVGALECLLSILAAAGLILLIRWFYWLVRRREGIGLGDAKLMALLAAWLGLPGALLAFGLGVVLGAVVALVLLAIPGKSPETGAWALKKLPLGTFFCVGGIVSSLWGPQIIAAYLRWAGL
jgi:leader peptidase (prepilin peptidase)/N-methyltransferase